MESPQDRKSSLCQKVRSVPYDSTEFPFLRRTGRIRCKQFLLGKDWANVQAFSSPFGTEDIHVTSGRCRQLY
jgi:hypothetical protein